MALITVFYLIVAGIIVRHNREELNVASSLGALVYELDRQVLENQRLSISGIRYNIQVFDSQGVRLLAPRSRTGRTRITSSRRTMPPIGAPE